MREQLRLRVLLPVAVLGLLGAVAGAFAFGGSPEQEDAAPAASAPAAKKGVKAAAKNDNKATHELSPLERELREHSVVVAVLYAPGASVDKLTIREARAGARAAGAGFVALDVSSDKAVASLATQYDLRAAPGVLVLARGPRIVTQFKSYEDRETVAQAVQDARA